MMQACNVGQASDTKDEMLTFMVQIYFSAKIMQILCFVKCFGIIESFIIFELNLEDTFTRCEKYSGKLDISRSFICIFDVV